jgi:hypothetical protein
MLASHNQGGHMSKRRGLAWGARNIGKEINRTERQAHHLLETGQIKAARKVGALWCAPLSGLDEQFYDDDKPAAAEAPTPHMQNPLRSGGDGAGF